MLLTILAEGVVNLILHDKGPDCAYNISTLEGENDLTIDLPSLKTAPSQSTLSKFRLDLMITKGMLGKVSDP